MTALAEALLQAQLAIRSVAKNARNEFSRYDYASADSIMGEARDALHSAGLVALRTGWTYTPVAHEHLKDEEKGGILTGLLISKHRIIHAESGESTDDESMYPVIIAKGKPEDKGLAAALTTSLAYWLRDILLLPRGLPEVDARDDLDEPPAPAPRNSSRGSTELADMLGKIADASSLEALRALGEVIRHSQLPKPELDRVRSAYLGRKVELRGDV